MVIFIFTSWSPLMRLEVAITSPMDASTIWMFMNILGILFLVYEPQRELLYEIIHDPDVYEYYREYYEEVRPCRVVHKDVVVRVARYPVSVSEGLVLPHLVVVRGHQYYPVPGVYVGGVPYEGVQVRGVQVDALVSVIVRGVIQEPVAVGFLEIYAVVRVKVRAVGGDGVLVGVEKRYAAPVGNGPVV